MITNTNEELIEMIRNTPDKKSLYMGLLYQQNRGMILSTCKKFSGYEDIDDLMQEAYIGLLDAVEKYDPEKGKFITYAPYWISSRIRKYIKTCCSPIKISQGMQEKVFAYKNIINEYNETYNRNPSDSEICEMMKISKQQLKAIKNSVVILSVVSIDKTVETENGPISLKETIADKKDNYEDINQTIDFELLKDALWTEVDTLEPREVDIIHKRYQDDASINQISAEIGLAPSSVRVIANKAIRHLRQSKNLRKYAGDYIISNQMYHGSLQSFRNTGTSATERVAIAEYERSYEHYFQDIMQEIQRKNAGEIIE